MLKRRNAVGRLGLTIVSASNLTVRPSTSNSREDNSTPKQSSTVEVRRALAQ